MKYYKYLQCLLLLLLLHNAAFAQKENFDIVSYTPPQGWQKAGDAGMVNYTYINKTDGSWCQLVVYKSVPSKGGIDADFTSEWQELVAKPNKITNAPQADSVHEADGWKIKAGGTTFTFNNADALALLTTFSNNTTCMSVLVRTNKKQYLDEVYTFMNSMDIRKPSAPLLNDPGSTIITNASQPINSGFKFNTTNFDDGWVATEQADWVQVVKGNITLLIHYANGVTGTLEPDRDKEDNVVWNNLVAPRYSNIRNYEKLNNNHSYIPVHFMAANLTDHSGKTVFVALFRKGNAKDNWIEIICPNRQAFVQAFGIDKYDADFDGWGALEKLAGYNKFAVAPQDLTGKWTTNFSGLTQYVNVYTGASAGMSTYQSNQTYNFSGNTYTWQIGVTSGFVGSIGHQSAKSNGSFSMPDNWHVHFSDLEGKPRDYAVQFTCVKGGRVLTIDGQVFGKAQ